jgi:uncharacterized protein
MGRTLRCVRNISLGLGFIVLILGIFISTESKGKPMNAETFFSGEQLAAYRLAHEGQNRLLMEAVRAGLDLNKQGQDRLTLLGFAVVTADREAIINLMRAGADPNQVIPNAGSPAVLAISKYFNPPRTEAVAALLDGGFNPNQLIGEGFPYLFYFVDYNHWQGLKLAIERGGNIDVKASDGTSLLTYIIEGGDYTQARELIAAGADVTARSQKGDTALKAIEAQIRRAAPSFREEWRELIVMRELILSKLPDPKDRHTFFTDIAQKKIRENPL